MTGYKHILVAADLVIADDNPVIKKAMEIGEKMGADISVIHAIEYPPSYGDAYEVPTVADWQEELEESAKERLEKLADKIGIAKEKRYLRIGQPKYQILEVADDIQADLIIIGSHARHGLGLLLLGSTANAVIHHAKCDVLAVRV
jgi:universal stress protein A